MKKGGCEGRGCDGVMLGGCEDLRAEGCEGVMEGGCEDMREGGCEGVREGGCEGCVGMRVGECVDGRARVRV